MLREPPYDDRHLRPVPDEPEPGGRAAPSADIPAEKALLSALLAEPARAPGLAGSLTAGDFYHPALGVIWDAIHTATATGIHDPQLVGQAVIAHLAKHHPRDADRLPELLTYGGEPLYLDAYAQTIRDASRLRRVADLGRHVTQAATTRDLEKTDAVLSRLVDVVAEEALRFDAGAAAQTCHVPNVKEFLTEHPDSHDWIIPGILERQDRVILTGGEGSGKSTLGRQVAVTSAAGIHPFSHIKIVPLRVLIIDFENSPRQMEREIGKLYAKVHSTLVADNLRIISKISGVDLLTKEDRDWMTLAVATVKPDLLITGPAYKMTAGDTDKEKESKPVALYLDTLRELHGCAIWLEAHVGNENQGSKNRPERPFGWSGWRRWPEFGLYLAPDGQLRHWRGDRDQRDWPATLARGTEWPWVTTIDEIESRWNTIRKARQAAGDYMSYKDVAAATGYDKNQIARTIGKGQRHVHDWTVLNGKNPYATGTQDEEPW